MHFESTRTFSADEVTVYSNGEPAPESATVLGEILVYDPEFFTKKEPYETTMQTLKESVAKNGGNAFYELEHREPSFWGSSNHRFIGHILLVEDTTINRENNRFSDEWAYKQKSIESFHQNLPKGHSVYANVNYAISGNDYLAYRDFQVDAKENNEGCMRNGISYEIGYDYVLPNSMTSPGCQLFVGVENTNFYGSATTKGIPVSLELHCLNPHFGFVLNNKKELLKLSAGVGYGFLKDRSGTLNLNEGKSASRYVDGCSIAIDSYIAYRFNRHFSLGVDIDALSWNGRHGAPSMNAFVYYSSFGVRAEYNF